MLHLLLFISLFARARQGMNNLRPRVVHLLGPRLDFTFEVRRVVRHLVHVSFDDQNVSNSDNQLGGIDRLSQEVRRTQLKRAELGLRVFGSRQDENRNMT